MTEFIAFVLFTANDRQAADDLMAPLLRAAEAHLRDGEFTQGVSFIEADRVEIKVKTA